MPIILLFATMRQLLVLSRAFDRLVAPPVLLVHGFLVTVVFVSGVALSLPAKAETLCWVGRTDSGLRSAGNVICYDKEALPIGSAYICYGAHGGPTKHALASCDPSWFGCSVLRDFTYGTATAGGKGVICAIQFRRFPESPCCSGAWQTYSHDKGTGKNAGFPQCPISGGNPIHLGTGNKYQREQDYSGAGPFPLRFVRHYNSAGVKRRQLGLQWRHTYDRAVVRDGALVLLHRADGKILFFRDVDGEWIGDPDVPGRLRRLVDAAEQSVGWEYVDAGDSIERYDDDGWLRSVRSRAGFTQTLDYDDQGLLTRVTGAFGRTLTFTYDTDGRIESMTDPADGVFRYTYDEVGNLSSVTYPDDTPEAATDDPIRIYHYEDDDYPTALTGISDETGQRFATWTYDGLGRAVSSSRAGGANGVTLTFNGDGTTTLVDAHGTPRTYSFERSHGVIRQSEVNGGPCAAGCSSRFASHTYDDNGYPATRTDFNGVTVRFEHDERGLQQSRTEASGTPEERTTTTEWHAEFRLPVRISEPGKTTEMTYDSAGRLRTRTEIDTADGKRRTTTRAYNLRGLLESIDGPRTDVSDVTEFFYDDKANLTRVVNALGHETALSGYDAHGRPRLITDANGASTRLEYDARGRMVSRDVAGSITRFGYDLTGRLSRIAHPDGSSLDYDYDAAGRLIAVTDTLGNRIDYELDAAGNRKAERIHDPEGFLTRTRERVYDELDRLEKAIGGEGQITAYDHDPMGNVTTLTDPNGHGTHSIYDALNRLISSTDPKAGITRYTYDGRDNLTSVTDPGGFETRYTHDGLDNLIRLESPDTGTTEYTHDEAGNRITQTDARGILTRYRYDALNRPIVIEYPDVLEDVEFFYDEGVNGVGRLTGMIDESGRTDFEYDARGNLRAEIRFIDDAEYRMSYVYDASDRLISVTHPSGIVISYARDEAGRIVSVSSTSEGTVSTLASDIHYAPFGPIIGFTHGNGLTTTRALDLDYRIINLRTDGIQDRMYEYDFANNIRSISGLIDPAADQVFSYDELGRLVKGQGIYGIHDYTYDAIGNRLSLSSAAGVDSYTYAMDSHRLENITGPNATSFDYDAVGNATRKEPLSFIYDDTNRLSSVLVSGEPIADFMHNGKGERVKKALAGGASAFSETLLFSDDFSGPGGGTIDDQPDDKWKGKKPKQAASASVDAGRARVEIKQAIRSKSTFTDAGDGTLIVRATIEQGRLVLKKLGVPQGVRIRFNGKRRIAVTSGVLNDETMRSKVVFKLDQPSAQIAVELRLREGTSRVLVTDDLGVTYDTSDVANSVLTLNDEYRVKLEAASVAGTPIPGLFDDIEVSLSTDAIPSTTTHFVYDQTGQLIGEYDAAGTPIAEYIYLEGIPLAMVRDDIIYYYHIDQLGTPNVITNREQLVVWQADYTPFGTAIITTNAVENNLRFPGQYFDQETGLHYNYFRDYDPGIGRYIESDPIGQAGGINLYSYVNGNPLRYSDLRGLESFDGGDLGALVPTGAAFFFGSLNALHSAFEGRVDSQSFELSSNRSDLRFIEAAVVVGICEKPCSAPSSSSVKLPSDLVALSIQIPGTRFGFEFRPDGTQCFTVGFGFSPFANESQPHLPHPPLVDPFFTGS